MTLYSHVIGALDKPGLAYLHFIEPRSRGSGLAEVNHQNVPSAMSCVSTPKTAMRAASICAVV